MAQSDTAHNPRSRGLLWSGIIVLVAAGLATGYFGPGGFELPGLTKTKTASDGKPACCCQDSKLPPCCAAAQETAKAAGPKVIEFALTDADRKETMEPPSVAFDGDGRAYVAWASQTSESERTLFLATSLDGGLSFDPPRAIRTSAIVSYTFESRGGKTGKRSLRMAPHLAVTGRKLAVAWMEAALDNTTVTMMLMESENGGLSFSDAVRVHHSDQARPTYTSLSAGPNGQLACSWLDYREGVQLPFFAARGAVSDGFREEIAIPAGEDGKGICPCCPTATTIAEDGTVYIAFRNMVGGYRDISVARWNIAAALEAPVSVVEPTWQFDGCPHDGPSLAVDAKELHVVWMDAHGGAQRVYYARASREDLKFVPQPLHESGPGTQGNAKICLSAAGDLHAVWEESVTEPPAESSSEKPAESKTEGHAHAAPTGGGRQIMHAVARAGGSFGAAQAILPREGRFQTRPSLAVSTTGKVLVTFHELDENGKRVVVIPVADAPAAEKPAVGAAE